MFILYSFIHSKNFDSNARFLLSFFLLLFLIRQKHTDKHALKTNVFYKYLSMYSIAQESYAIFLKLLSVIGYVCVISFKVNPNVMTGFQLEI